MRKLNCKLVIDVHELINIFKATLDQNQCRQAEEKLNQMKYMVGFSPELVQAIVLSDVDSTVRKAAAIYLKNFIVRYWLPQSSSNNFTIDETDRSTIRNIIIDTLVYSPDFIRSYLSICVGHIVRHDFPDQWTEIVDKIKFYLESPDSSIQLGSLLCLYKLISNYDCSRWSPLKDLMDTFIPLMYRYCYRILNAPTEQHILLQKQILKIHYALVQYALPCQLVPIDVFRQWIEIALAVILQTIPCDSNQGDKNKSVAEQWWNCKKWALRTVHKALVSYGIPDNISKEYYEFSDWYVNTFSYIVIKVLMSILDQFNRNEYVSPRVMELTLDYLNLAVNDVHSWKFLKPHMSYITQQIIYPLLWCTTADIELYYINPHHYIRQKFVESHSSKYSCAKSGEILSAQNLLHTFCKRCKSILHGTLKFIMKVLCTSKAEPCRLYGALDMLGTLNDLLMDTKSDYKDQMEQFLYYYVTPEFCHSQGYIRAKAYWVFRLFNEIKFKHEEMILASLFHAVVSSLIYDPDLPVRAAAATSLHMLLQGQNLDSFNYIESEIEQIVLQLLKIIYETEEIGLVCFLQNILSLYCEKLKPIIIDICQNLAKTFKKITETNNERSRNNNANVTVLSILSTIESLLISFENETEIIVMLNPVVVDIVTYIFLQNIKDYYDNACSLIYNLTNSKITPEMWKLLHLFYMAISHLTDIEHGAFRIVQLIHCKGLVFLYDDLFTALMRELCCIQIFLDLVFQRDGFEYFADTIYILRNFVTVDTSAFLLDERNMLTILDMCKTILTGNAEENQHYSVVQLLGTIVNHCLERIDQHIPFIVELILNRLFQEIEKSELRTACQQIIKNVYDYNPGLLSEIMDKLKIPTLCKEILYVEISCM